LQVAPTYLTPKERAALVDHQHYVRDTMQDFNVVPQEVSPVIVNSHDIPISRRSFTSMSGEQLLNDDIINWTLSWWRSQIGGGQNNNKTTTRRSTQVSHDVTTLAPYGSPNFKR
jgi:hypothetical protein